MRVRHRIPSIFNLSMVDVLCCALGCVILLWLINLREAKDHEESTAQQSEQLSAQLASVEADRKSVYLRLSRLQNQIQTLQQEQGRLQTQLADEQDTQRQLQKKWQAAQSLAGRLQDELKDSQKLTADLRGRLNDSQKQAAGLQTALKDSQKHADDLQSALTDTQKQAAGLQGELKDNEKQTADLRDRLRLALAQRDGLAGKLRGAEDRLALLQEALTASAKKQDAQIEQSRALLRKLEAAGDRIKELQARADLVPGLQDDLKAAKAQYLTEHALAEALEREISQKKEALTSASRTIDRLQGTSKDLERDLANRDKELALARSYRKKWADSEERLAALQKELATAQQGLTAAQQGMVTLEDEKKKLQAQAIRIRNAAANHFAGIALTGRQVIFLVDMSGSMELVDLQTPAPNKWSDVANTVARLMRSMPDLEKFQVIVFAEKASFLLGEENTWLSYDPRTSADQVVRALSGLKPKGGTNLHAALRAAFAMRSHGLDTIYLLSDGLPNLGEGISEEEMQTIRTEEMRSSLLARYLRKTLRESWNRPDSEDRRVRINTIGFFFESPDIGAFLWALARENEGSFVGMSKP